MQKKIMTLCCVLGDSRILLGMKKRGFGEGRWNGFGGKVHAGETVEAAARRELKEEAGIVPLDMRKRGVILFKFEDNGLEGNPDIEVNIFSISKFSGKPTESEEMKPQWFLRSEIPYASMWSDDIFWLPLMLAGKDFRGTVFFDDKHEVFDIP
jgi:8-oxo-dGTP pyrophosphatase MutT (NUDIX family)